jgi:sulfate adenylyltransferase (ADP) / ATP adenylyltransferase
MNLLEKGTLWQRIVDRTAYAFSEGALMPVPTDYKFLGDGGIRFLVRILLSLARKEEAREQEERESSSTGEKIDPFLPYDNDLFVAEISHTHIALLNKFNVVEHHLLIVTRQFEDQEMLLTLTDFEALMRCLAEYKGLGFYNGGREAGASQGHKHIQIVPLPLSPEGPGIPIDPLLEDVKIKGGLEIVPGFPFLHVFARLHRDLLWSEDERVLQAFNTYSEMLRRVGMKAPRRDGPARQSGPYCLLVTMEWMLLVPRSREFFDSISINSLGFAGALLVQNPAQLKMIERAGPITVLKSVALPLF